MNSIRTGCLISTTICLIFSCSISYKKDSKLKKENSYAQFEGIVSEKGDSLSFEVKYYESGKTVKGQFVNSLLSGNLEYQFGDEVTVFNMVSYEANRLETSIPSNWKRMDPQQAMLTFEKSSPLETKKGEYMMFALHDTSEFGTALDCLNSYFAFLKEHFDFGTKHNVAIPEKIENPDDPFYFGHWDLLNSDATFNYYTRELNEEIVVVIFLDSNDDVAGSLLFENILNSTFYQEIRLLEPRWMW